MVPLGRGEIAQALALARSQAAGLLHVYLGSEAVRAVRLLEQFPAARIVSFHGADLSHKHSAEDYTCLWPNAELFLCRSESLQRDLVAKGCPESRIRINYTGVPVKNAPMKKLPNWQNGELLRLLQVCRFIEKKGLDVTLRVVRRLKDQGVPIQLVLAGGGPEEARLRRLASELGLAREVQFAGFVSGSDLEGLFCSSNIFIHPSRVTSGGDREGIPNSLLEAMSFGLPVVSTRHSGIPEAITHGVNGMLSDRCETEALVADIRRLLEKGILYERISVNARRTIKDRFSTTRCIEQLEAAYSEALTMRTVS
jgi:colanic acid/amylovoran biosynthesis glycosyltransferase